METVKSKLGADSPRQLLLEKLECLKCERDRLNDTCYDVLPRDSQTTLPGIRETESGYFDVKKLAVLDNEALLKEIRELEKECKTLRTVYEGILGQRTSF